MKDIKIRKVAFVTFMILVSSVYSVAKSSTTLKLIEISGYQKVLSQRVVKDYLYSGAGIATSKAQRQLKQTIKDTLNAQKNLKNSINNPKILNMMMFLDMNYDDIKSKTQEKFSKDNAQYILDLSESLLEGNQYILKALKESSQKKFKTKVSKLIDMSSRQAMLSQRIAKYYIAYQLGIKDKNTIYQMKTAVENFSKIHKILMKNQTNTPQINVMLKQVDKLWNIVYKFYLDIEIGGLPFIVFNTTDKITDKMKEISLLYLKTK